jgi:hypothetical protein
MAKAKSNGDGRLEEALTQLIQNQASFVQNQAAFLSRMAETDRISSERFARIEAILLEHSRILMDLNRMLRALPEAVREKIGFKGPDKPA